MPPAADFATKPIQHHFQDEISQLGGTVRDSFDDGRRLFTRAVLTNFRPVAHADDVQAGVALRADEERVCVHPYVFRLVCNNGAIWAHALESVSIADPTSVPWPVLATELGAAVRACASPSAFENAVAEMRTSRSGEVDMALQISAIVSGMARSRSADLLDMILERYVEEGDPSRFGLMNAITAAARDSDDPEERWQLEALGAGVPVGVIPPSLTLSSARSLRQAYVEELENRCGDLMPVSQERFELAGACR